MGYEKLKKQPPHRADGVGYHEVAPGLYHDEIALRLDDGTLAAVSVERHWQENGSGIAFHGYARWIEEDGKTKEAPNGAQVEAALTFHADPVTLGQFGEDAIATDVALVLIGEELKLYREVPEENGPPSKKPVLDLSEAALLNASIRHQVKAVTATKSIFIGL